jgi:ABC-type branched-subunit amino acid transport system ATPase component
MVTRPKILLLDEPASGLSSEQRARLAARLAKLGETVTVFLVEHDLQMVMDIAEEIFVLLDGRVVFTGDSEEFRTSSIVRQELMGLLANDALETI